MQETKKIVKERNESFAVKYHFDGGREAVRSQTIKAALELVLANQ